MEEKKNIVGILFGVFLTISVLLGGFIVYDKFIKKDNKPECEKTECNCEKCEECQECEKCDNTPSECKCPKESNYGEKISSFKELKLTDKNQTVKIGKKEYKLKIGKGNDDYEPGSLYINDEMITYESYLHYGASSDGIIVDHIYLTDKFIFTTTTGQFGEAILYVFDGENEMFANNNYWQFDSLKLKDGYIHATGMMDCFDGSTKCKDNVDLIIKYIDNTLIVTPFK